MKKTPTKAERAHLSAVASLGCIACSIDGLGATPAQIHHIREGCGMGQRASHYEVIPLCPFIHHVGDGKIYPSVHNQYAEFVEKYGTERELLDTVLNLLETKKKVEKLTPVGEI